MTLKDWLPHDLVVATLLGRLDLGDGPTPVIVRGGPIEDVSRIAPTTADLLNDFPVTRRIPAGRVLAQAADLDARPAWDAERETAAVRRGLLQHGEA